MKNRGKEIISLTVMVCILLLSLSVGYAAIPYTINYQGYLTDSQGTPVNGTVSMVFSLYTVPTGGTALWSEVQNVSVNNGIYSVILGSETVFGGGLADLDFHNEYFLGIKVGSDPVEMTPRQPLTSVGYAFTARTASDLACAGCISQSDLADNAVTSAKIQDGTISFMDIGPNGCTPTQIMKMMSDGSWDCDTGIETDPQVGVVTAGKWCTGDGVAVQCSQNPPVLSETDPQVGTLTSAKWCTSDGSAVNCTQNAPLTSESDPQVNTLTANQWCTSNAGGSAIDCAQSAPALSGHNHDATYVNEGQASSITSGMIQDGTILCADINHNSCTNGQVMKWNGTAWACATDNAGSGDNLGNHTATQNIKLGSYWLSGDGGNEGLSVDASGNITMKGDIKTDRWLGDNSNTFIGINVAGGGQLSHFSWEEGWSNTGLGSGTLYSISTGDNNTAAALHENTTGYWNTAVGSQALALNTIGRDNTALGRFALSDNETGHANTALGSISLSLTMGHANTAVGYAAGYNAGGDGNVFLGAEAGYNELGSNKLYIANSKSNNLIYGEFDTKKVCINCTNPSTTLTTLDVNGNIRLRDNNIWLRGGIDEWQGLGWYGMGKPFAGVSVDGPVLFGWSGGALGTTSGGQKIALKWDWQGNVHVTGNFTKGSGSFKIDHPLDPENKYLYHSFVESPDMKNIYDGIAVLDKNGEAWVELPEWFEALNKDFRYQLTCIGGFAPVYIAEKISDNRFKVAGGKAGMEVSYQVTGIRQDPYANAHRIVVEEEKPDNEKGTYLHPDVYVHQEK